MPVRSGPTCPPSVPIVWQLEQATFSPKNIRRPRPTSPPAPRAAQLLKPLDAISLSVFELFEQRFGALANRVRVACQ